MALLFSWWVTDFIVALLSLLVGVSLYCNHVFKYWERRGVPFLKPSIPFGNIGDIVLLRQHFGLVFADIYSRLEGHKFGGCFQFLRPTLVLRDPDLIRSVLVKDFNKFQDRGIYFDEKKDPLAGHLFFLGGTKWKTIRAKLTPTFSSGKMKMMFDDVLRCGQELTECIQKKSDNGEVIEIKDLIARYSTDVIATCAFGIQCNSLKDPDSEFRQKGQAYFNPSALNSVGFMLNFMSPYLSSYVDPGGTATHITKFFLNIVKETVDYREKNDVTRNDFMQLLIQLKNKGFVEDDNSIDLEENEAQEKTHALTKLSLLEISAQAFAFFLAGFETSSTTVSFCLFQLALNPAIQSRLRAEVDAVLDKHGGTLTYDAVMDMEYLTMVIDETMRMYPPLPFLNRQCNTTYKMADSEVVIDSGTAVIVPVYGLHHDPKYYPEPEKFDPQRFTREEKAKRVNYTYMPFGEGPRTCIGTRFGYLEIKTALISLVSRFEFRVSKDTILNLVFNPKSLTLSSNDGIFLDIVNRD